MSPGECSSSAVVQWTEVSEPLPSPCSQRWSSPSVQLLVPALCGLSLQLWLTDDGQMRQGGGRSTSPHRFYFVTVKNTDTLHPGSAARMAVIFFILLFFFPPSLFFPPFTAVRRGQQSTTTPSTLVCLCFCLRWTGFSYHFCVSVQRVWESARSQEESLRPRPQLWCSVSWAGLVFKMP